MGRKTFFTDFAFIEQSLWIRYDTDSLPYSDMREEARISESRYSDWMHNFGAAAGVCQYHASCMALALADNGISWEALDWFQAGLTYPRSECKLRNTFFQDRVVRSGTRTAAMRAFASETLEVFMVLGVCCRLVICPEAEAGALADWCNLTLLMCEILDILKIGVMPDHVFRFAMLLTLVSTC